MSVWIAALAFVVPFLIAYKHTQQAAHMLEGWARRERIKIGDAQAILFRNRERMIALGITVFGAEAIWAVIFFRQARIAAPATIWMLIGATAVFLTGVLLTARATHSIYSQLKAD